VHPADEGALGEAAVGARLHAVPADEASALTRSYRYVIQFDLPISPSSTMSTPASICLRTTPATASRSAAA
jgi:hypothetical protein